MSSLRVTSSFETLRRKLSRVRDELRDSAERRVVKTTQRTIAELNEDPARRRRAMIAVLEAQFRAVFIPVRLKGVRREQWPDLEPIYRARIARRQKTFRGRKRFYVDESKLDALFDGVLARRLRRAEQLARARYEVIVLFRSRVRVTVGIVKRGKLTGREREHAMLIFRQTIVETGEDAIVEAFRKAGL